MVEMRASRLLHLLLLLQNRGRLTARQLADELEVTTRTILRDIDALTEVGLPVIAFQGNRGGFEIGFNYRSRLTGLSAGEVEALAIWLETPPPALDALGIRQVAALAGNKLIESLPDNLRIRAAAARRQFSVTYPAEPEIDKRVRAMAEAVRHRRVVRLRSRSRAPMVIHPVRLVQSAAAWEVIDQRAGATVQLRDWGDLNISAATF